MPTRTITHDLTLTVVDCYKCAIVFAVPSDFDRINREKGGERTWYCPNGHGQVYARSEVQKLRDKLTAEQQRREAAEARETHERDQREAAERSASAYKGRVTRLKNRAAAGVCPCCNRSFENLRRHMASKHPGFEASDD